MFSIEDRLHDYLSASNESISTKNPVPCGAYISDGSAKVITQNHFFSHLEIL